MITVGQIHKQYGVSPSTVYYLMRQGRLPAVDVTQPYHTRRRLKFRLSDVERVFGGKDKPAKRD